jgi:hypothetical protein
MKLLFFDIDGTLAIGRKIPQENLDALNALKEKGYLTFICTGRVPFYARELFGSLTRGIVSCNGRHIELDGQVLKTFPLSNKELEMYKERLKEMDGGALLFEREMCIPYNLSQKQIEEGAVSQYRKEHIANVPENEIYNFDVFYKDQEHLGQMKEEFKDDFYISDHFKMGHADCSFNGYDKGDAIAWLCDHFQVDPMDSYAFGDGHNDLAMFKSAGNKIAMGNAVDELKEKATYITTRVDEGGIVHALKHFGLLD